MDRFDALKAADERRYQQTIERYVAELESTPPTYTLAGCINSRDAFSQSLEHCEELLKIASPGEEHAIIAEIEKYRRLRDLWEERAQTLRLTEEPKKELGVSHFEPVEMNQVADEVTNKKDLQPVKNERRDAYQSYKRACKAVGVPLTEKILASLARTSWNDRTPVCWWKSCDPRSTAEDDRTIRAVFKRDPETLKR